MWPFDKLVPKASDEEKPAPVRPVNSTAPRIPGTPWAPPGDFSSASLIGTGHTYGDEIKKNPDGTWGTSRRGAPSPATKATSEPSEADG